MAKLTQDMKNMISKQQCFYATVDKNGIPNNAPKRSTYIFNDKTLLFYEIKGGTTYRNILDGSNVSVAVVDKDLSDGYRFSGVPEVITSGDIYDNGTEYFKNNNLDKPLAIVLIHITEIYSLKPGSKASKK